ncbi:MAG: nucleotide exchange factor GrpE [Candidatus Vogelbacteria bacterium]|nr:nucleotide exchange factor GrpE [Candidatus Vogelbacteria bacterium]
MEDEENKIEVDEDLSFDSGEDFTDAGKAGELAAKIVKLKSELKTCKSEKGEYLAGWQRAKADYLNLKKEEEAKRGEVSKYAKADVLNDLIRLADSFAMAFADKEAWESVPANWRQGVEYIHNQLLVVFRDHGLEELDPQGEMFDPARDESVGTVPAEREEDDGRVLEVIKKGYRLDGKIIRPAQVRVGEYKKQ